MIYRLAVSFHVICCLLQWSPQFSWRGLVQYFYALAYVCVDINILICEYCNKCFTANKHIDSLFAVSRNMGSQIAANKHIDSLFAASRNMDSWIAVNKHIDSLFAYLFAVIDGLREGRDDNRWTQNGRDMCIYRFRVQN